MAETLTIPARFNGPPDSGNGGYCAGVAGALVEGQAEVTLRAPPPLDTPLAVVRVEDGADVMHGETLVMQARRRAPLAEPAAAPPSLADAEAASTHFRSAEEHLLPTCFVCGPLRAPGDGLRIFAAHGDGVDGVAAPWTPADNLAAADGRVGAEHVWAALDCPGYFALDIDFALLGRFAARLIDRPAPKEPLIVTGWSMGADGRKHKAGTALYTAEGRLLAHAEATWVQLK